MSEYTNDVHPDTGELYIDLGDDHPGYTRYIYFSGDMEVYTKEDFEVADKIVRACNSHEELLEAAKRAVRLWDNPQDLGNVVYQSAAEQLRTAIEKAEAKP